MSIDYEFKNKVLQDSNLLDCVKSFNKSCYYNLYLGHDNDHCISLNTAWRIYDDYHETEYKKRLWDEAQKILSAYSKKICRLKKRIKNMLDSGNCSFVTLTFNDETLYSTTPEQRRSFAVRFLKGTGVPYVANIDYGDLNGREHYHCVIQSIKVNFRDWHKFGGIKGKKVITENNESAISKYVCKLTNHAIKESTKRQAIIYSR